MTRLKLFIFLALGALVSACADARIASRNAPFEPINPALVADANQSLSVAAVSVRVPKSLRVNEANSYYPSGDIVWRGDPLGDRYQQVAQVMYDGLTKGTTKLQGTTPVKLDVEVLRFHAITEKARYSTGGVHNIVFALEMRHAETGLPVGERRVVTADLRAYGGAEALAADGRGETQRMRIEEHLAKVIQIELTDSEGYQNKSLGLIQQINRL